VNNRWWKAGSKVVFHDPRHIGKELPGRVLQDDGETVTIRPKGRKYTLEVKGCDVLRGVATSLPWADDLEFEWCECGHPRSDHLPKNSPFGRARDGHGACTKCDCAKYTFDKIVDELPLAGDGYCLRCGKDVEELHTCDNCGDFCCEDCYGDVAETICHRCWANDRRSEP